MVLVPSAARTASSTSNIIPIPEQYTAAIIALSVSAASGTAPTLNLYVQNVIPVAGASDIEQAVPTGTDEYDDLASFTQATGTGTWIVRVVGGGNAAAAKKDASLTAGSVASGPIGRNWRIKWVVGGTNPSFTFSLSATFIP